MLDFCVHLHGDGGETYGNQAAEATEVGKKEKSGKEEAPLSPRVASGLAIAAKVNVIRLVIAYATSMVLHFQLLDAASDSAGEIDDVAMKQVLFLYCRLRALLYEEEMSLLDDALSVVRTCSPGTAGVWRA